jgi:ligand-binding sensor domain-containing protein
MNRAVLGLATDRGVIVLKPGEEATGYTVANQGILNRRCPCLLRAGDGKLIAGTEDFFVQRSPDGQEWKSSLEGLKRTKITALARHPQHKHLVFAGTSSPAVYLSANHGETWKALAPLESLPSTNRWTAKKAPFLASVTSIACHSEHAGVVFVTIQVGGLAASKDGGKTWIPRDQGLPTDVRQILAPPVSGRLYLGTGHGFFRSDNLGGKWEQHTTGLPYSQVRAMAVAGSNSDVLVLSLSGKDDGLSALAQSKDGGLNWEVTDKGLPRLDNRVITALTFGKGGFYAGTDQGDLFGLDNLEGRWTRLGSNYPPINDIVALA